MPGIKSFRSPLANGSGRVKLDWHAPGDAIPFEMTVEGTDVTRRVRAEVWTNANHNDDPKSFDAIPMRVAHVDGRCVTYRTEIPIHRIGNYRATGRILVDGSDKPVWADSSRIGDVRFRPRDEAHDSLNIMLVNIGMANCKPETRTYGTMADMLEPGSPATNGRYTLEFLASQGINALWLQGLFENSKWEQRLAIDDAASPYATKDFLSVRKEISRYAEGLEGEDAWKASIREFDELKKRCDELGIKLILDVAPNHVGHNYEFRDLFVAKDAKGRETREVRANDFSQIAINPEQLQVIKKRLADPNVPNYMEYIAPHMYGKYEDPHGARSVNETTPGGWWEWRDTKQLNHGRMRFGNHWWDVNSTVESEKVLDWLGRVLRFWAVDRGVHGFRLDHLTGMPERFLENTLNQVQADVDRHTPGRNIFFVGEDFHTNHVSRHWLDNEQGGFFRKVRRIRTPEQFRAVVDHPWNNDLHSVGSHDEDRFIHHFDGDRQAATRLLCLLQLIGGPVLSVMGDEFGEWEQLQFRQYKTVPSFRRATRDAQKIAHWKSVAGLARARLPALQDNNHAWMPTRAGGDDPDILAATRASNDPADDLVLLFASFNNSRHRSNVFRIAGDAAKGIDPEKRYQVHDYMSTERHDGGRPGLWDEPILGREILNNGVYADLRPYQIQVLALREAGTLAGAPERP